MKISNRLKSKKGFTLMGPKDHKRNDNSRRERTHKAADLKGHRRIKDSDGDTVSKSAFTLIELIVVMAVIGILVLLASPKFLGYTEHAKYTRDIHLAKTLETGLEDFLVHGGKLEDHLEEISRSDIQLSADKNMLLNPRGFVEVVEDGVYYELTHDFIKNHLNVKVANNDRLNDVLIEAMAAKYPVAAYAEQGGKALVDRTRGLKGIDNQPVVTDDEISDEQASGTWLIGARQIVAGEYHALVIMNDGSVKSWGFNDYGILGNGNDGKQSKAVNVTGLNGTPKQIVAGEYHSAALMEDGSVYTWGGENATIGDGTTNKSLIPKHSSKVTGPVKKLASGTSFQLALMEDGTVMGWGHNYFGQLGYPYAGKFEATPRTIIGLSGVKDLVAGRYNAFALMEDGTIMVWGRNDFGQLGDGTTTNRSTPVKMTNIQGKIKKIAPGDIHTLVLMEDGRVLAWGGNDDIQLDATRNSRITPEQVPQLEGKGKVIDIVAADKHSLALMEDGTVIRWGYIQSGGGVVDLGGKAKEIMAGLSFSLVLMEDGTVKTWGFNNYGQMGVGNYNTQSGIIGTVINNDDTVLNINQ